MIFTILYYDRSLHEAIVTDLSSLPNILEKAKIPFKVYRQDILISQKDVGKGDFDYWLNKGDTFSY